MMNLIETLLEKNFLKKTLYVDLDSGGRDKPTMILLHGIAATSKTWDVMLSELNPESYRIITIDLLGFGSSPKPDKCNYDVNDHVKYIHRTIKKLHIKKPYTLVGHSMGSIITARYCLKYPRAVKRAYLLSLPLYLEKIDIIKKIPAKLTDFYINAYNLLCENKAFTIKHSQRLRKLLRVRDGIDVTDSTWHSFRMSLQNTIISQDTYSDLKAAKVPMHVFYGSLDQFLIQDNMKRLNHMDNIEVTRLSAVDHSVGSRFSKVVAKQINEDILGAK